MGVNPELAIRPAGPGDIAVILGFIRALAEFERLAHEVVADEAALALGLFGPRRYAECLIAIVGNEPAGFALYFHNFSTFTGKPGLYLEEVFVDPCFRGQGIGEAFFRALAKIAVERDCARFEWSVLDWNENAIRFYRRLGADPKPGRPVQRLTRDKIEKLANG